MAVAYRFPYSFFILRCNIILSRGRLPRNGYTGFEVGVTSHFTHVVQVGGLNLILFRPSYMGISILICTSQRVLMMVPFQASLQTQEGSIWVMSSCSTILCAP